MAASGLFVNWAPVTMLGTSPTVSIITLTEVLSVEVSKGGKIISFYGDARRFARGKKTVEFERGIKITSGNPAQFLGLEEGGIFTIVATLQDMNNGVGSGAITVTLVNCMLKSNPVAGANNDFGKVSVEFEAFADSSDTDPLSFVIAT
jgi:hypothetical protein